MFNIHRKSEESSHDIRHNRGNIHGFHEFYMLCAMTCYFLPRNKFKTSILPYSSRFSLYLAGEQSDEIRHSSFTSSKPHVKPHEVKFTAFSLQISYKQMSWRTNDKEEKRPDLRLVNLFQLPSWRISRSRTRSGTNLVIILEALCALKLIYSSSKWRLTKCMLKIFALSSSATY